MAAALSKVCGRVTAKPMPAALEPAPAALEPAPAALQPGSSATAPSAAAITAERVRLLNLIDASPRLPSKADDYTIAIPAADAALAEVDADAVQCRICDREVPRQQIHAHVGACVFKAAPQDGGSAPAAVAVPHNTTYCGFCGASDPACTMVVGVSNTGKYAFTGVGAQGCPGMPSLRPSHAWPGRSTRNAPCSNVPDFRPQCKEFGRT